MGRHDVIYAVVREGQRLVETANDINTGQRKSVHPDEARCLRRPTSEINADRPVRRRRDITKEMDTLVQRRDRLGVVARGPIIPQPIAYDAAYAKWARGADWARLGAPVEAQEMTQAGKLPQPFRHCRAAAVGEGHTRRGVPLTGKGSSVRTEEQGPLFQDWTAPDGRDVGLSHGVGAHRERYLGNIAIVSAERSRATLGEDIEGTGSGPRQKPERHRDIGRQGGQFAQPGSRNPDHHRGILLTGNRCRCATKQGREGWMGGRILQDAKVDGGDQR